MRCFRLQIAGPNKSHQRVSAVLAKTHLRVASTAVSGRGLRVQGLGWVPVLVAGPLGGGLEALSVRTYFKATPK